MPIVTVGVQRNNLWSLKFNEYTNILIPNLEYYCLSNVKKQLSTFPNETEFEIGLLRLTKKTPELWLATFPGIPLSFSTWIVSENSAVKESMQINCTDEDMKTLLEFLVHMFSNNS